jgi:hypothetical protein
LFLWQQFTYRILTNNLWGSFPCQYQYLLTVSVDVQLVGAYYRRQFLVILHRQPKGMIYAILFEQLPLQM